MEQTPMVAVEREGRVAIVTLNRPEIVNAFNANLRADFLEAVRSVDSDAAIRVAVLKGAGRGFCAGADLAEEAGSSVQERIEHEYKPFLMGIANSEKIWIASVHGSAAGIGASLAMTCDLVVMAEEASLYLAFATLGLIPDGGASWHLLKAMGYRRAFEAIVEGHKLSSAECLAYGLANRTAPGEWVHETSLRWAATLAAGSPLAQGGAKRVLRHIGRMRLQDAITLEAKKQETLSGTEDFYDAVEAFFAGRKPEFKGR